MHIYLMTRGIWHDVERFVRELSAKYLPYKGLRKGSMKVEDFALQVAVRPIQLWEIVFPEEHKEVMLNSLFGEGKGVTLQKKHRKFVSIIRKILGVDKIPDYKYDNTKLLPFYRDNIEMIGIGIKKDYWKDGVEKL